MKNITKTDADRFFEKVMVTDSCWFWTGCVGIDGYAKVRYKGKCRVAHRVSYEIFMGPIGMGLTLDHLCRVRNCVKPEHLEPVSMRVNTLRGTSFSSVNAAKIFCIRGHNLPEYSIQINGIKRRCKTCSRIDNKIRWIEKKFIVQKQ